MADVDYAPLQHGEPERTGPGDVPALLRRVAESIERLGPVEVHDICFGTETTEDGPWHHLTVYFDPLGPE